MVGLISRRIVMVYAGCALMGLGCGGGEGGGENQSRVRTPERRTVALGAPALVVTGSAAKALAGRVDPSARP